MELENELDLLFGDTTDAKVELERLMVAIDGSEKPSLLKEPISKQQEVITETKNSQEIVLGEINVNQTVANND